MVNETMNEFGGRWTGEKLEILKKYLDAYTTALKKQKFKLLYIDAFAGTGFVGTGTDESVQRDQQSFIEGSAKIAMDIESKPFDELIFIERNREKCLWLENLKRDKPGRNILVENDDANDYLFNLQKDWKKWRGVLFLDPFGAQVNWRTVEKIAECRALDTWILFPTLTISRMLPKSRIPDDISTKWVDTLNRVYGDESWRDLYRESSQMELFNKRQTVRCSGAKKLIEIYKGKLGKLFGERFLEQSVTLKNSKNSPLYEFMFCVGSTDGAIQVAKRIASHLLKIKSDTGM